VQKFRITKYSWNEDDGRWSDLISMAILDEEWDVGHTKRGKSKSPGRSTMNYPVEQMKVI